LQLISDKIQIIRFYLSLVRSDAYGKSEVKLFISKEITNRWGCWFVVQAVCVRNIPDKIGFVRDTGEFTTTMKTRFMFALNVDQFCCVRFAMPQMLFVIERNKNLFHHFKAIYQFPKHIIFLVKIVANASFKYFERDFL
jgi:hypothetical protein